MTTLGAVTLGVLGIVGTIVWGALKPLPSDTWTQDQVVRGYYDALTSLDTEQLSQLTSFQDAKEPELRQDQEGVTNLYVIRQVRTAYEHQSPVLEAQAWVESGQPPLKTGQLLYGLANLQLNNDSGWTARYQYWTSEGGGETPLVAMGEARFDHITLTKTRRGWKISSLHRERKPLR